VQQSPSCWFFPTLADTGHIHIVAGIEVADMPAEMVVESLLTQTIDHNYRSNFQFPFLFRSYCTVPSCPRDQGLLINLPQLDLAEKQDLRMLDG
jgi:hypothetical protein